MVKDHKIIFFFNVGGGRYSARTGPTGRPKKINNLIIEQLYRQERNNDSDRQCRKQPDDFFFLVQC